MNPYSRRGYMIPELKIGLYPKELKLVVDAEKTPSKGETVQYLLEAEDRSMANHLHEDPRIHLVHFPLDAKDEKAAVEEFKRVKEHLSKEPVWRGDGGSRWRNFRLLMVRVEFEVATISPD